ncbi:MAG: hypothetical protein FWD23_14645, partial [Oscillospiraceae bacterium]|nr:hypothetical protein [Oscillospiraceae bacterium]
MKPKRIAFVLFMTLILLVTAMLPDIAATSQIDYNGIGESTYGQLENMRYNFMKSVDEEKYYAGAYWEGDPYLLDGEGNVLLYEDGSPFKNLERDLHILVTDLSIVPKELNHPKLFFDEVKYS